MKSNPEQRLHNWTKALNFTSTYDVDGDSISDGQEYNGYNVTMVWIDGDETKSEDKKVYGDPLYAYKDQNDNSPEVDEDGIPRLHRVRSRQQT